MLYNEKELKELIEEHYKKALTQCPKRVSLRRSRGTIQLQFTIGEKRVARGCNCYLSLEGIDSALRKAHRVAAALQQLTLESEFNEWYEREILERKCFIKNDLISFKEAIKKVENNFWDRLTKKHGQRDRNNPSHQSCWWDVYGNFYALLPIEKVVNFTDMVNAINSKEKGSKARLNAANAMKRLCKLNSLTSLLEQINSLELTQTKYADLQTISLDKFLEMREQVLMPTEDKRIDLQNRRNWMFVFSLQVVYGFRIHEVWAVQNLLTDYKTKDGIFIPALNRTDNEAMLAVIGSTTSIGTTTKTGYRIARPLLPPTHPELIETLQIKEGKLPDLGLSNGNNSSRRRYIAKRARQILESWDCGITQTHAFRHLANLNGMMSGVSLEKRAMSLGHSPQMNDSTYKRRNSTKTTIDLLTTSETNSLSLEAALIVVNKLGLVSEETIKLLAVIYNLSEDTVKMKLS